MIDIAVGFVLGGGAAAVVQSVVKNLLMPPLSILTGKVDFANRFVVLREGAPEGPYKTLEAAADAGAVTLGYGLVINAMVSFLLVAFAAFLIVRGINRLHRASQDPTTPPVDPVTRLCSFCISEIPVKASRCPQCTSELPELAAV